MPPTRESILGQYRDAILEGMARSLWLTSYADWVEELTPEEREELGVEMARGGQDWDDVAPETPKAANKAALELAKLYEAEKTTGDLVELYGMAQSVDMGEHFSFSEDDSRATGSMTVERARQLDHSWKMDDAHLFGSMLAMMALGHGVSWFDDHKQFELTQPHFECHYDGEDLIWSGGSSDVREVSGKLGRITIVNPGDASWTRHSYVLAFGAYGDTILMAYANSLDDALDECIDWLVEHEPGHIVDDQVNEEYARGIAEGLSEEAAMEAAEVDTTSGGNAGNHINSGEWTIVAEDPSDDDLQKIAHRKNPPRCKLDHADLKRDPKKWQQLQYVGTQHVDEDETGPAEDIEMRNCTCGSTLAIVVPTKQNPGGRFTAKGERMYQSIKRGYTKVGEQRAKEIAARTVEKAASHGGRGLVKSRNPGPDRVKGMAEAKGRAERALAARRSAGFEGGCDDPHCRGWDVFETDRGFGVQACDMCNAEAKRQGLPTVTDMDVKELPAARAAHARMVGGGGYRPHIRRT